jgi:hypothetical protein
MLVFLLLKHKWTSEREREKEKELIQDISLFQNITL